jgi:hypothetical protein
MNRRKIRRMKGKVVTEWWRGRVSSKNDNVMLIGLITDNNEDESMPKIKIN